MAMRFFMLLACWDWRFPVSILSAPNSGAGSSSAAIVGLTAGIGPLPTAGKPDDSSETKPTMCVELPVGSGLSAAPYISHTTAKIIEKELRRGHRKMKQVELGAGHLSDVYAPARFFQHFEHYLQFDFTATSEAVLAPWLAWGRQQMRGLCHIFQSLNFQNVTLRPWPDFVAFKDNEWPHACAVFVGLTLHKNVQENQAGPMRQTYDMREVMVQFMEGAMAWPEADKNADQFDLTVRHVQSAELEQWLVLSKRGLVANAKPMMQPPMPAIGQSLAPISAY